MSGFFAREATWGELTSPPLPKGADFATELSKPVRGMFQVRVAKHWGKFESPATEIHARFLRELTARLVERDDIFRGLIGPGHPGHADHFHFDVAPWRYVRL